METRIRRVRCALLLMTFVLLWLPGCGDDGETPAGRATTQLAELPPMGWNSWNRFHCEIDENLIRQTADALVDSGMRDAGYVYVNIDDCWQAPERAADGTLDAHPQRFPSGIAALAKYAHQRGLKLGIYAAPGAHTCAGRPGSLAHEEQDARNFAAWGIDYLKYDWCGAEQQGLEKVAAFTQMSDMLRASGRAIVYSISEYGEGRPWVWGRDSGANLWRTTGDIFDNWISILLIMNRQGTVAKFAAPQGWNDPDMLEVGNGGMSDDEYRSHFSLWAIMNAPLLAGNDVRAMSPATREILTNREVIAVDQDWGGSPGLRLQSIGMVQVWGKPMSDGSFATLLWNSGDTLAEVRVDLSELGLSASATYQARNLWAHTDEQLMAALSTTLAPHAVAMYRISLVVR